MPPSNPTHLIPGPEAPAPHPARLLLVTPDALSAAELAGQLAPHHAEIRCSSDADCIATAGDEGVELLLMHPATRSRSGLRHGLDAWQRLHALRDRHPRLPVLVLLPGSDAADRAVALELGADAVLDLPCHDRELRARVAALLRRSREQHGPPGHLPTLQFGAWQLDPSRRRLRTSTGQTIALSHAEARLLEAFLRHPCHALSRSLLLDLARGSGVDQLDRSIDVLISRLRHKLGDTGGQPRLIRTVRGVGYLFTAMGV